MRKKIVLIDRSSFACPMAFGKYSHVKTKEIEFWVQGPEYETTALLGGNLGIGEIEQVAHLNSLCDELGLDTISTGSCIAFAMECFEKKLLSKKDTDGLVLKFGSYPAAVALIGKIAKREGLGALLAKGVKQMAKEIGKGSEAFAMQIKGLEISGYEARCAPAMMLSYATADIGAHHNRSSVIKYDLEVGPEKIEGKAKKVVEQQHTRPLFDMWGTCQLPWAKLSVDLNQYHQALTSLTGIDFTLKDLLTSSERVWNLNRMFLLRENGKPGINYDQPPKRWLSEPMPDGPTKGCKADAKKFAQLLQEYYQLRGWDKNGNPTPEKLKELGILELVEKSCPDLLGLKVKAAK